MGLRGVGFLSAARRTLSLQGGSVCPLSLARIESVGSSMLVGGNELVVSTFLPVLLVSSIVDARIIEFSSLVGESLLFVSELAVSMFSLGVLLATICGVLLSGLFVGGTKSANTTSLAGNDGALC